MEIVTTVPATYLQDGSYWLTAETTTGPLVFSSWCDMSYEGGGWTLAMIIDDDSTGEYPYNDTRWVTEAGAYDDPQPTSGGFGETVKYHAFNWTVADVIRLQFTVPEYNLLYSSLDGRTLLTLFSEGDSAVVDTEAGCGEPLLDQTEGWHSMMQMGTGSQFFGVNGNYSEDCSDGNGECTRTRKLRLGYGATNSETNRWEPLIGIGAYTEDVDVDGESSANLPVIWRQNDCSEGCAQPCQGEGSAGNNNDTNVNVWIR
jgi:hypothetical protein